MVVWKKSRIIDDLKYIDYAHTEASLESVLRTLHVYKKQDTQLIVLFGATGDRDRDKRSKRWEK